MDEYSGGMMLSFVIPVWNQYMLLLQCLDSIFTQTGVPAEAMEILLVDNGSREEEKALLIQDCACQDVQRLSRVHRIELSENTGFSHAVNLGVQAATGDLIVLLNSDVVLTDNFVAAVVAAMEAHPDWLHAATRMRQAHHRDRLDDAGNLLLPTGRAIKMGYGEPDAGQYGGSASPGIEGAHAAVPGFFVFSACGGAAVFRKTFFERVGYLDEDFFAYLEDVDLGFRAQRMSLPCGWIPEAVSHHIGSASTGSMKNTFTVRLQAQNQLGMLVKNLPGSLWILLGLPILVTMFAQWIKHAGSRNGNGGAYLKGLGEALRLLPVMHAKRKAAKPGWTQPDALLLGQMITAGRLYRKSRRNRVAECHGA